MSGDGGTATLADFLADLESRQVRLRVDGEQLRCTAPSGVLTDGVLARIRESKQEIIRHIGERELLPRADRGRPLPLSFGQEQLWLTGHLDPDSSAYHIPLAVRLSGPLHLATLRDALAEVVRRHEALRTSFPIRHGRPCQVVAGFAPPPLPVVDLSGLPAAERARAVHELAEAAARRTFDLANGPVMRAILLRLGPREHRLLLTRHHIASDGWSFGVLATELSAAYRAFLAGGPSPLAPLGRQYVDYAAWQRSAGGAAGDAGLDGWLRRLDGAPLGLDLVDPRALAQPSTEPVATLRHELGPDTTAAVREAAKRAGSTVFAVLMAAFGLALASAAGQREVVVGSPASGRSRPELEPMIGCFATVLPLRLRLAGEPTFRQAVRSVHDTLTEALAGQDVPLERIADGLRARRRQRGSGPGNGGRWGRSPLFAVAFAFQNTPDGAVDLPGVAVELDEPAPVAPKFPLTITVTGSRVLAEFDRAALDPQAVRDVLDRFFAVLAGGCAHPELAPAELLRRAAPPGLGTHADPGTSDIPRTSATPGTRAVPNAGTTSGTRAIPGSRTTPGSRAICDTWASQESPGEARGAQVPEAERTLGAAFAEVAGRAPDAIAVSQNGHQLSYGALHHRACRLAGALRAAGVTTESPVALCVQHGLELAVAVLGVTLAGGCYVPVDPEDPPARREAVLADGGAVALVTLARHAEDFEWFDGPVLRADDPRGWPPAPAAPAATVHPGNLAYVIYTSGSTGSPKGVMVSHAGVTALFAAADRTYRFTPQDCWSLTHSSAFDFSVWELWGALLTGGRVAVVPRTVARDPDALGWVLRDEQVTVYSTTPSAFLTLAPTVIEPVMEGDAEPRTSVRAVVFGGERCEPQKFAGWFEAFGDERPELVNMYGITETTVHVTVRPLTSADAARPGSPIGAALPGVAVHIVDAHGVPVAVGGQGELLVGGTGVARGYLHRPGLTADRFRPDHLGAAAGARLYHSGDLGRRLPGGDIGYLGRLDQQLKVRGYRIEPGEVEAVLAAHPDVAAAAVGLDPGEENGRASLVGYVVAAAGGVLSGRELRRYLSDWLPAYMVPGSYVVLDTLPLTRNGKLDHAALRSLSGAAPPAENAPPQTPTEIALAGLWCELLGLDAVGVHDDFFDLGGDSLLVTRLHARLPAIFGVELPMRRIYQAGDIAAQAEEIDALLLDLPHDPESRRP